MKSFYISIMYIININYDLFLHLITLALHIQDMYHYHFVLDRVKNP